MPTPPIDSNPTASVTIAEIFNFDFFIRNADIITIHDFLATASATTDGRNLKSLWKRAFEEGRNHGLDEGMLKCSEDYARGHKVGCELATTYFDIGREQGVEEGEEHGREVERQVWISSGHDEGQCTPTVKPRSFTSTTTQTDSLEITPIVILSDKIVQTDSEQPTTATCEASIQASEPPPYPSQPQKTITVPLDWAEEANSLPITPLPPSLHPPRDLSVLRSSSSSPFSSLQHRSKRFFHYSRQPHRHHSRFNFNSFYSPHHNSFKPSKTNSHLNWESDPRLSDLSRSLKALGWIRAP
jgi:hypothetical protein